jgi:hypothetical protein
MYVEQIEQTHETTHLEKMESLCYGVHASWILSCKMSQCA